MDRSSNTAEPLLPAKRAALYIRVSTEEQARKGYSLPAQQEALENYAGQNGYDIAGLYIDDGVSAHQVYTRRPGLMRLLADVQAGKIDTVLFIKLDRWFRSVKEYYKVKEVLDAHHVTWKAVLEDYETETAQGVLVANLMLTIAQAESDRTSERIKFVFESKVARGEVITGRVPFGYRIEDKHLVIDPEKAELAREMFRHYARCGSLIDTMRHMRERGISVHTNTTKAALSNALYKGEYRGNPNYCEPIIPPEEFDAVQGMLEKRSIRSNPTGRVYLFSGILYCSECGHAMTARFQRSTYKTRSWEYSRYICPQSVIYHQCIHNHGINEAEFETWLLSCVAARLDESEERWLMSERKAPKSEAKAKRAAIVRKLEKLKDLYMDDLITKDRYRADYERYQAELSEIPDGPEEAAPDFEALRALLSGDFQARYQTMPRPDRRAFWRSLIAKITLPAGNQPTIYFKSSCY